LDFAQGSTDFDWEPDEDQDRTLERLMDKESTFLPISFLEVGLICARSVVKVKLQQGTRLLRASGFLTVNNVLVTNNHVLRNETEARAAVIQFNYQKDASGLDLEPVSYNLDPDSGFATSEADDWTLVKVEGNANDTWGAIEIKADSDIEATDRVNIIQHPGGEHKQIAVYHNIVAYADETRVQYLTDTLPGSSGSPVFNSQWDIVALHHSGGHIREPGTKRIVYRNEGINIRRVLQGLEENGLV
jgi:V8-like Glu-specific endopeptidase